MNTSELLTAIDSEISRLQQVRSLLTGGKNGHTRPGKKPAKKRILSAEARERIAAAQRKRWAAQKKAAKKAA
jgi:hypothetical protein